MDRSLEVFNVDRTKNGEVTRFTPLKLEINRHKKNQCSSYWLNWYGYVFRIWLVG